MAMSGMGSDFGSGGLGFGNQSGVGGYGLGNNTGSMGFGNSGPGNSSSGYGGYSGSGGNSTGSDSNNNGYGLGQTAGGMSFGNDSGVGGYGLGNTSDGMSFGNDSGVNGYGLDNGTGGMSIGTVVGDFVRDWNTGVSNSGGGDVSSTPSIGRIDPNDPLTQQRTYLEEGFLPSHGVVRTPLGGLRVPTNIRQLLDIQRRNNLVTMPMMLDVPKGIRHASNRVDALDRDALYERGLSEAQMLPDPEAALAAWKEGDLAAMREQGFNDVTIQQAQDLFRSSGGSMIGRAIKGLLGTEDLETPEEARTRLGLGQQFGLPGTPLNVSTGYGYLDENNNPTAAYLGGLANAFTGPGGMASAMNGVMNRALDYDYVGANAPGINFEVNPDGTFDVSGKMGFEFDQPGDTESGALPYLNLGPVQPIGSGGTDGEDVEVAETNTLGDMLNRFWQGRVLRG